MASNGDYYTQHTRGRKTKYDPTNPQKTFVRHMDQLPDAMGMPKHPNLYNPVTKTSYWGEEDGVDLKLKGKPPGFDYEAERRVLCNKALACGHKCADPRAYNIHPCSMCTVPISIIRECGHSTSFFCGRGGPFVKCYKDCGKIYICGHPCSRNCSHPLCGIGTCGGYRCVADFPEQHKEFLELASLHGFKLSDDDWGDEPERNNSAIADSTDAQTTGTDQVEVKAERSEGVDAPAPMEETIKDPSHIVSEMPFNLQGKAEAEADRTKHLTKEELLLAPLFKKGYFTSSPSPDVPLNDAEISGNNDREAEVKLAKLMRTTPLTEAAGNSGNGNNQGGMDFHEQEKMQAKANAQGGIQPLSRDDPERIKCGGPSQWPEPQ